MSVTSVPFWQQSQNWRASQTKANAALAFATSNSVLGARASTAQPNAFGATMLSSAMSAAILAAQEAANRLNKATVNLSGVPTRSVANVAVQVTFAGSVSGTATFGAVGPSASGGFQFLSGAALKAAFAAAMIGQKSHGEAIDTVSVSGNTLTASTSGANPHTVFTLSLAPSSGLYTFTLVNPIDLPVSRLDKFTTLNLSGLLQAVKADGTTMGLSNSVVIQVHNGQGIANGTPTSGTVFEGGLAYTGPNLPAGTTPSKSIATKPNRSIKYTPPINPLTGRGYVATSAAARATTASINIFA